MVSWKTYFFVKILIIWNYLQEIYNITNKHIINFYSYLKNYIQGYHDIWLFIPGHSFPLSMNNLNNMIHIDCIYDNYDSVLTLGAPENVDLINCKLSWLSAKIKIIDSHNKENIVEYNIDNFIDKFSVETTTEQIPTLYMIFMCWCAYTKHWFKPDDEVQFNIIDDSGEEICLNMKKHNECLIIKSKKIYIVIHDNDIDPEENNIVETNSKEILLNEEDKNKEL